MPIGIIFTTPISIIPVLPLSKLKTVPNVSFRRPRDAFLSANGEAPTTRSLAPLPAHGTRDSWSKERQQYSPLGKLSSRHGVRPTRSSAILIG